MPGTYGAYLDAVAAGKPRIRLTVDQLRSRLRENRGRAPKAAARQERPPERKPGIRISMDGRGLCMDNIFIERLWRLLKYEAVYLHEIAASGNWRAPWSIGAMPRMQR